jgi:predicted HTH transcriptional regulator
MSSRRKTFRWILAGCASQNPQDFATLLARGYEVRAVEFKGPGPRTDPNLRAKVIRAALGMANLRDVGRVVIGVAEIDDGRLRAVGLCEADLATWQYDDVASEIAEYADPYLQFDLERLEYNGAWYVILHVYEFEELPILCRRDLSVKVNGKDRPILRRGALYVRSRHKPETAEVRTQEEMREILEMAIDKGVRRFMERAHNAGLSSQLFTPAPLSDAARFEQQGQDLV